MLICACTTHTVVWLVRASLHGGPEQGERHILLMLATAAGPGVTAGVVARPPPSPRRHGTHVSCRGAAGITCPTVLGTYVRVCLCLVRRS